MRRTKNNHDTLVKSLLLGVLCISIIAANATLDKNDDVTTQPDRNDPGEVTTSAPAIEDNFEAYVLGSNINGQGNWIAYNSTGCSATVQTIAAANKWLRLTDGPNPATRKVEAFWNFTTAAPKLGSIRFHFQMDDVTKNTTMMIADLPHSEIMPLVKPSGAAEIRVNNGWFEAHNGTGNTWVPLVAAVNSNTYLIEICYKIGAGWHVFISGVMYGGEYRYRYSFTGNPASMRLFEVMTSSSAASYNAYFDDVDISWTPNVSTPTLTTGSVTPSVGTNKSTQFVYTVTYTDADNNPAQWVNVTLDGSRVYTMTKQTITDNNFLDGCIYRYATYLNPGDHSYFFNASDGTRLASLGPFFGPKAEPQWNETRITGVRIGCVISHGETNPRTKYIVGVQTLIGDLTARGTVISDINVPVTAGVLRNYEIIWIDRGATSTITQAELDDIGTWVSNGGKVIISGEDYSYSNTEYRVMQKFNVYIYNYGGTISGTSNQVYSHPIMRGVTSVYFNTVAYLYISTQPLAVLCAQIASQNQITAFEYGKGKLVFISDDSPFLSYTMASNRLLANNIFGWLGYVQKNDFAPTVTLGTVSPGSGAQNTPFTFSVRYTDTDNFAPEYVRVTINGSAYNMTKANVYDFDYSDGCTYKYTTYLQPGNYQYSFQCYDGKFLANSMVYLGPIVGLTNLSPPTLTGTSLFPFRGYASRTRFNFTATYTDPDNNAPQYITVRLNATPYTMVKNDPTDVNFIDGCAYVLRMQINSTGNYTYSFNCSDGATQASVGTFTNLEVEPYVPIYFDGMIYDWTGFFNWTGMTEQGSETFTQRSPLVFDVISEPGNSFYGDRTVDANSRFINDSMDFWYGSHEWTRIFIDIGLGSIVPITTIQGGDQQFTVTGATYVVAMNRSFECWRLQSSQGSIAFYDKFSGLLINGTFKPQIWELYAFQIRATNAPVEENHAAPKLSGESVNPASGMPSTLFTFNVTYMDDDDNAPAFIDVVINGTAHAMSRQIPTDFNMVDGCYYIYSTYLQVGSYQWFVNCSDGMYEDSTGLISSPTVTLMIMMPPTLNLGNVAPKSGYNNTTPFTFTVDYRDTDNSAPTYVRVMVNGTVYAMQKQNPSDVNYMDGCVYTVTTFLSSVGTYTYLFTASDGLNTVSNGPYSNCQVSETHVMFFDKMY
nr:hypothetical protein [Candidatus Sigynarchaeota archaeon]